MMSQFSVQANICFSKNVTTGPEQAQTAGEYLRKPGALFYDGFHQVSG
jgi:hypothetical protein